MSIKSLKCGIITIHNIPNYGATFQALGLLSMLNSLPGIDAEFIDYQMNAPLSSSEFEKHSILNRFMRRLLRIKYLKYILQARQKEKSFKLFWQENYKVSNKRYKGDKSFLAEDFSYDIFIAGSDQLFNLSLTNQSKAFFLPLDHGYRFSYSTSFGMKGLEKQNEHKVVRMLRNFHALSVREPSVSHYLEEHYGLKSEVSVDPVFLLTANEWKRFSTRMALPSNYVFCYIMSENPNANAVLSWIRANEGNIPVFIVKTCKDRLSIRGRDYSGVGPAEFLSLISNATYVVTNSFHGCALGIIHRRKVFSLEEERFIGDQRYRALLNTCDAYDKIVPFNDNWNTFDFEGHVIDGDTCYNKLVPWIEESKEYLLKNIKLCQD